MKKIEMSELPGLMSKYIFLLSEEELNSLGFIMDLEISQFHKCENLIKFRIKNSATTAYVECFKNSNISMGKKKKSRDGHSGLISWGGCFSFTDIMRTYRTFISRSYEFTMKSPEKLKIYSPDEWMQVSVYAFDEVFTAKEKSA